MRCYTLVMALLSLLKQTVQQVDCYENSVLFNQSHVYGMGNGKSKFVPRDQVFPLLFIYCSLYQLQDQQFNFMSSSSIRIIGTVFISLFPNLRNSQFESNVCRSFAVNVILKLSNVLNLSWHGSSLIVFFSTGDFAQRPDILAAKQNLHVIIIIDFLIELNKEYYRSKFIEPVFVSLLYIFIAIIS